MKKRGLEVAVISDVHLGSHSCHADELLAYLSSIQPKILILNGDIIDIENSNAYYFPPSHFKVIRKLLSMASKGVEIYYIMGNHDESFRKFSDSEVNTIKICEKLTLNLDGKKAWFFHGDVLDISLRKAKWIAKFGTPGYRFLILLNKGLYKIRKKLNRQKPTISKRLNLDYKQNQDYESDFIRTVVELALYKDYAYVVCGHLHRPKKELVETKNGNCLYLNSGDWTANLTALEYSFKRWKLYQYHNDKLSPFFMDEELKEMNMNELLASISMQKKNKKRRENEGEMAED